MNDDCPKLGSSKTVKTGIHEYEILGSFANVIPTLVWLGIKTLKHLKTPIAGGFANLLTSIAIFGQKLIRSYIPFITAAINGFQIIATANSFSSSIIKNFMDQHIMRF